ncbi:Core-2/I-Branching enzyme [Cooperia oncophora]
MSCTPVMVEECILATVNKLRNNRDFKEVKSETVTSEARPQGHYIPAKALPDRYVLKADKMGRRHEPPDVIHFYRKVQTAHIDCGRLLKGDQKGDYAKRIAASRPTLSDQNLPMKCEDVRARVLPPKPLKQLQFGIAHARIVYESYEFIEDELRSSYHPQNIFCYAIDHKAEKGFTERIETLAKCLPNVVVPKKRFSIGREGINGTRAHYECMKALMVDKRWGYAMLMQNYDVMIKDVYETVSILQALGGANDVHARPCERRRYDHRLKWDVRSLKFYRNASQMTPSQLSASLTFARGAVHASLSRAAVDWMVNTIDLTKTFEQLDRKVMGVDEVLIPTLFVSEGLSMPGGFTAECIKKGRGTGFITRSVCLRKYHM